MWRILLFCLFLSSIDGCAIGKGDYGNICVCNATYCDKAPKVEKLTAEKIQIVYTSDAEPGFHVKEAKFTNSSKAQYSVIVEINSKKTYQKIIGFGGSFTDSVGMNIESLPPAAGKNLIEAYFGEDGLEYTLCRVPMGGSDFSPRAYTLDDNHNDEDLKKFALQKEDFQYKVQYIALREYCFSIRKFPAKNTRNAMKSKCSQSSVTICGIYYIMLYQNWSQN